MEFHHFIAAIKLLQHEFKAENEELKDQSDLDFAKLHLYC
jgi:hypothetical protein